MHRTEKLAAALVTMPLLVEEWRQRDLLIALGTTDHPLVDKELGTRVWAEMPPVPAGFAGMLMGLGLGRACAEFNSEVRDPVRSRLLVRYHRRPAVREQVLAAVTMPADDTVRFTCSDRAGEMMVAEQVLGAPVPVEEVPVGDRVLAVSPLERVQLARWAYAAHEMWPIFVNHVYATAAGHPAVVAPDSLALGCVEVALTGRGLFSRVAAIEMLVHDQVHAGDELEVIFGSSDRHACAVWLKSGSRVTHSGTVTMC